MSAIGYRAYPYDPARRETLIRREGRALLVRGALALLAMMQVMMLAFPGVLRRRWRSAGHRRLLEWASLVLTLPVVLYCATPFFAGAWRDIRHGRVGMDVPVALGIGGAFLASVWSTLGNGGAVYYDSVTMFVALLLCARWLELRARERAGDALEAIAHELPATAERLADAAGTRTERIVAHRLKAGDRVRVAAGAAIPADGIVVEGRSSVEEALLTGESSAHARAAGDRVYAGSVNRESPLIVRVEAAGDATTLAALGRLVERAASERPRIARLADRVARRFVAVLLFAAGSSQSHGGTRGRQRR